MFQNGYLKMILNLWTLPEFVDGKEKMTLESVNDLLIKEGHAVVYNGGKRK